MLRLRLYDLRLSRLPSVVGLCQSDTADIAAVVNSAQRRLLFCREASDEGWWGTWAEIAFNVSRSQPYITLPREIARIQSVNVCDRPVPIQNQFYEYLQFGNGRLPKQFAHCRRNPLQGYSRNNVPTFVDLTSAPQNIAIIATDSSDMTGTKRVFIQGLDNNGNPVVSQDGNNRVQGEFVTLASPFATGNFSYSQITGIQKDITNGQVNIYQMDPVSGAQILLLTMQPSEQTAWYRRYYFDNLPCGCCPPTGSVPAGQCTTAQVTAIAKLEMIPVAVDTDYTLIQNMEAIIEESASIRYSQADTPAAKQMAADRHAWAVRMLNGELTHYLGTNQPAINFAPFGSAHLFKKQIGSLL